MRSLRRKFCYLTAACILVGVIYAIIIILQQQKNDDQKVSHVKNWRRHEQLAPIDFGCKDCDTPKAPSAAFHLAGFTGPQNEKQEQIVQAFKHAWSAYKKYAWGHDELKPVSRSWNDWFGIGLTIVDSLDTMYIMGLKDEFKEARDWVEKKLDFEQDRDALIFEVTIRSLGGLLSAYHLTNDTVFLNRAKELAVRLEPCLRGPTKIPCSRINLKTGQTNFLEISTAESGTIQLELRDLSRSLGDPKYEKMAEDVALYLHGMDKWDGLVATYIEGHSGSFKVTSAVSVGGSADSYYEYLLKQWLQTGRTKDWLKNDYLEAVEGVKKHLIRKTEPSGYVYTGSFAGLNQGGFRFEMEHLSCFFPGLLALGYAVGLGDNTHLELSMALTNTCHAMYTQMPTGLSPELVAINTNPATKHDFYTLPSQEHNLLRPEAIESCFYLYRVTKRQEYRDWAWQMFVAMETHAKMKEGYDSIMNVKEVPNVGKRDKMESFFLAETLKYLYLLFSDDDSLFPFDQYVFNTEAHPLPIYAS